jgi:hypothetical protein
VAGWQWQCQSGSGWVAVAVAVDGWQWWKCVSGWVAVVGWQWMGGSWQWSGGSGIGLYGGNMSVIAHISLKNAPFSLI